MRIPAIAALLTVPAIAFAAAATAAQLSLPVPRDPSALGYLDLHKRHPDELEGQATFDALTSPAALQRLEQMRGFLESFSKLTDRARNQIPGAELQAIGNTGREMQTIGFHNIPLVVEGTLLKQDYQLKQVEYELALTKQRLGEATLAQVEAARSAYALATKRFQLFWDTKRPTD
jgi:hypothetical protein